MASNISELIRNSHQINEDQYIVVKALNRKRMVRVGSVGR
jgi:hypothetical protein